MTPDYFDSPASIDAWASAYPHAATLAGAAQRRAAWEAQRARIDALLAQADVLAARTEASRATEVQHG